MAKHLFDKLKKLTAMPPSEVIARLQRALADRREHAAFDRGEYSWSSDVWRQRLCRGMAKDRNEDDLASLWLHHLRNRSEPPFLMDRHSLSRSAELYRLLFNDRLEALCDRADRACQGQFSFLGFDFKAADPIAWQSDPLSGRSWPSTYFGEVRVPFCDGPLNDSFPGDAKNVWELNRHEFLVDCAKAFHLTGDERYAAQVFNTIESWVAANPYLQGVNWAGPLEVAVRALSWIWAYQFCRYWDNLPAGSLLALIQGLYLHGAYLYRHLEIYTSPNNHLIGEATALYLLGILFPEFDEAAAWRERGWQILAAEPERQFFADGVSTEQSTSYHYYCLGFFLLAVLARQRSGETVPPAMLARLEKACEFGMWMTLPDGTTPSVGDADDSRSIRLGPSSTSDFRNLLSLAAVIFDRADMRAVAGSLSEDALWLLGPSALGEVPQTRPPTGLCKTFSTGGYVILRSGWGSTDDHLCFDSGEIGLGLSQRNVPVTTHGHADILSFTLAVAGKPLLVDAGLYTFSGSETWHRYCRDVAAHNTVRVDSRSQAKLDIHNAWSRVARPEAVRWQSTNEFECIQGGHSGFAGARDVGRHRRAIICKRGSYWVVLDRIEGQGTHEVESFFHFAPGRACAASKAGLFVETDDGLHARLLSAVEGEFELELRCGQDHPAGGWIAPSYGVRAPAPVACFRGTLTLPTTFAFLISAAPNDLPPAAIHWHSGTTNQSIDADGSLALAVDCGHHSDVLRFRWLEEWLEFAAEPVPHPALSPLQVAAMQLTQVGSDSSFHE